MRASEGEFTDVKSPRQLGTDFSIYGYEKTGRTPPMTLLSGPTISSRDEAVRLANGERLRSNPSFDDPLTRDYNKDGTETKDSAEKTDAERQEAEADRIRNMQKDADDSVAQAYRKIRDGVINFIKVSASFPLSINDIHTNEFLYFQVRHLEKLSNFNDLYEHFAIDNNSSNRDGFQYGWWYVESINIVQSLNDYHTDLTLTPIASNLSNYVNIMYKAVEKYEEELAKVNAGKDGLVIYGDIPKNVAELGAKLVKGKSTDIDKARALYDFFWQNCDYEFYSGHVKSAEKTLNDLAGNCMDLANLYKSLAESVKLACEFRHANSVQFSDGNYSHYWNAVNVSGTIIGLDVSVACDPYNKTSTSKINQMFGFGNMEHPYPHSAVMVATTM